MSLDTVDDNGTARSPLLAINLDDAIDHLIDDTRVPDHYRDSTLCAFADIRVDHHSDRVRVTCLHHLSGCPHLRTLSSAPACYCCCLSCDRNLAGRGFVRGDHLPYPADGFACKIRPVSVHAGGTKANSASNSVPAKSGDYSESA